MKTIPEKPQGSCVPASTGADAPGDLPLYYIQNKRFCGNCLLWWRIDGHGYTVNLDEAWKVTQEMKVEICRSRPSLDVPWLVSFIDSVTERHASSENPLIRDAIQQRRWCQIADLGASELPEGQPTEAATCIHED
jgi:hypothetical protein